MNTKVLMSSSAAILGIAGMVLSFFPEEISTTFNAISGDRLISLLLQLLGAAYFAFAMLNWNAKANLIGGIYSRPVALANFSHFTIGALALIKAYSPQMPLLMILAAVVHASFALLFGYVLFTHPIKAKSVA